MSRQAASFRRICLPGDSRAVILLAVLLSAVLNMLNMDDAGGVAAAAAMGMMLFSTDVLARLLQAVSGRLLLRRTQAWRLR